MQDLSLHILDIVENSIDAGATMVEIVIEERIKENLLKIKIKDNGKEANGKIKIDSKLAKGTVGQTQMSYNHIDRKPLVLYVKH